MTRIPYGLGAKPSPPDRRDYPARAFLPAKSPTLPTAYRLPVEVPIYDQLETSMCVDFSCRTIKELQELMERGRHVPLANGYIYGNRAPTDWQDEGMYPREALSTLLQYGIPPETAFRVMGTFEECRAAYLAHQVEVDPAAKPQRIKSFVRCNSPEDVQRALVELRSPVMIATGVTTKFVFWTSWNGRIFLEPPDVFREDNPDFLGGHAMVIDAYVTDMDGVLWYGGPNSWGTGWGEQGRFWIRADYPGIWELWTVVDQHPSAQWVTIQEGSKEMTRTIVDPDGSRYIETIQMDIAPVEREDRTCIPLRWVGEALGAAVHYEEATQLVRIHLGQTLVVMKPNDPVAWVNGEARQLDVAPWVDPDANRLLVPLRFVGEAFGFTVEWNSRNNTVNIVRSR